MTETKEFGAVETGKHVKEFTAAGGPLYKMSDGYKRAKDIVKDAIDTVGDIHFVDMAANVRDYIVSYRPAEVQLILAKMLVFQILLDLEQEGKARRLDAAGENWAWPAE